MNARMFVTFTRVCACALVLGGGAARAQSPPDTGVVPDDDLMLVVGTRFVGPSPEGTSAKAQFDDARIPLSKFNETDHCVDQTALEIAKEYFTTLGRMVGKAAQYYFVPEAEIRKAIATCERSRDRCSAQSALPRPAGSPSTASKWIWCLTNSAPRR